MFLLYYSLEKAIRVSGFVKFPAYFSLRENDLSASTRNGFLAYIN